MVRVRRPLVPSLALLLLGAAALPASPRSQAAAEALLEVHLHDAPYAVEVYLKEAVNPDQERVFLDLPGNVALHPSFDATVELCQFADPYNRSDSEIPDAEIDAYLALVAPMAPIQEALRVTGGDLEDLRRAWFRGGRGFEHVVCGESGSGMKLGGYHFWYAHYRYERDGRAAYTGADYGQHPPSSGFADPRIVTGKMRWDADGDGGYPPLVKKPRGGFTVGHSVAAMLAAGYLALEAETRPARVGTLKFPNMAVLEANLNGKTYPWTFHHVGWESRSIRTFWPRFVPGLR